MPISNIDLRAARMPEPSVVGRSEASQPHSGVSGPVAPFVRTPAVQITAHDRNPELLSRFKALAARFLKSDHDLMEFPGGASLQKTTHLGGLVTGLLVFPASTNLASMHFHSAGPNPDDMRCIWRGQHLGLGEGPAAMRGPLSEAVAEMEQRL